MEGLQDLLGGGTNGSLDGGGDVAKDASPIEQLCSLKAMSMLELMFNATARDLYVKQCIMEHNATGVNNTGTKFEMNIDAAKEAAIIAIYCCLSAGCLLGNIIVISVILANKTMRRSITNILIVNLAVADFGVGVFSCVQVYMESSLQASSAAYSNSPALCKFQQVLQVAILSGSVCILLIICIDRYLAILYPMMQRQHRKKRLYIIISLCCWLIALFFALPNLHFYSYDSSSQMCQVRSGMKDFFFIYYCVSVALLYVVPFIVMAFAYGRVSARLISSISQFGVEFTGGGGGGRSRGGGGDEMTTTIVTSEPASAVPADAEDKQTMSKKELEMQQLQKAAALSEKEKQPVESKKKSAKSSGQTNPAVARKRTVQMFITIVAVFFLCKLPKTIYVMILLTNPAVVAFNHSMDVLVVAVYLLYLLPSASNPIIYFLFSRQYRAGFMNLLTCQLE